LSALAPWPAAFTLKIHWIGWLGWLKGHDHLAGWLLGDMSNKAVPGRQGGKGLPQAPAGQ